MKTENLGVVTSISALSDLTKNRCININGGLGDADQYLLGVCVADTLQGEQAPIAVSGIALVESAEAITKGHILYADNSGKVAGAVSITPYSSISLGTALDSATAAGELIRVLLK